MRTGLRFAAGFGVVATVGLMVGVSRDASPEPFANYVQLWLAVLLFYTLTGILSGAIYGCLKPWRRRYVGRAVIAYVIANVVYGTALIAVDRDWREEGWWIAVFLQLVTIPVALLVAWLTRRWVRAEAT